MLSTLTLFRPELFKLTLFKLLTLPKELLETNPNSSKRSSIWLTCQLAENWLLKSCEKEFKSKELLFPRDWRLELLNSLPSSDMRRAAISWSLKEPETSELKEFRSKDERMLERSLRLKLLASKEEKRDAGSKLEMSELKLFEPERRSASEETWRLNFLQEY